MTEGWALNTFSFNQVMFHTEEWEGSLFPWDEHWETLLKQGASRAAELIRQ